MSDIEMLPLRNLPDRKTGVFRYKYTIASYDDLLDSVLTDEFVKEMFGNTFSRILISSAHDGRAYVVKIGKIIHNYLPNSYDLDTLMHFDKTYYQTMVVALLHYQDVLIGETCVYHLKARSQDDLIVTTGGTKISIKFTGSVEDLECWDRVE